MAILSFLYYIAGVWESTALLQGVHKLLFDFRLIFEKQWKYASTKNRILG